MGKRVMPSYIMTGGNIQLEQSKVQMTTEDIAEMVGLIGAYRPLLNKRPGRAAA